LEVVVVLSILANFDRICAKQQTFSNILQKVKIYFSAKISTILHLNIEGPYYTVYF